MKALRLLCIVLSLATPWASPVGSAAAQSAESALDPAPEGSFSIVVIPDTQQYLSEGKRADEDTEGELSNPVFDAHTRWIVENVDEQRIVFVSHVGDIVDVNNHAQWRVARQAMDRLHGRVPYGLTVGNHDMTSDGNSALFQEYFPASRFEAFDWYGGTFPGDPQHPYRSGNNANSYQLISAEDLDFLMLHLECNAPDDVLEWADEVVAAHPDRWLIVTTHMDLGPVQKPVKSEEYFTNPKGRMTWTKRHEARGNSPQQLWEKFYGKHENLLMVFSGDQSRTSALYQMNRGDRSNIVHALLSDYTSSGPLRVYRFKPQDDEIQVITYDTTRDEVISESTHVPAKENHQFVIEHELSRATVPGQ